jgi:hypothetical protein
MNTVDQCIKALQAMSDDGNGALPVLLDGCDCYGEWGGYPPEVIQHITGYDHAEPVRTPCVLLAR